MADNIKKYENHVVLQKNQEHTNTHTQAQQKKTNNKIKKRQRRKKN